MMFPFEVSFSWDAVGAGLLHVTILNIYYDLSAMFIKSKCDFLF